MTKFYRVSSPGLFLFDSFLLDKNSAAVLNGEKRGDMEEKTKQSHSQASGCLTFIIIMIVLSFVFSRACSSPPNQAGQQESLTDWEEADAKVANWLQEASQKLEAPIISVSHERYGKDSVYFDLNLSSDALSISQDQLQTDLRNICLGVANMYHGNQEIIMKVKYGGTTLTTAEYSIFNGSVKTR